MAEAPGVKFKNSLIFPNVQKEIDAQDSANPKPIPVIWVLWESRNDPELGIARFDGVSSLRASLIPASGLARPQPSWLTLETARSSAMARHGNSWIF
jgi:hypothetical protein